MSREDSLVTTEWAEQNLSTPGLVFVEVDEDTTAYDTGHIPGAVKINWKTELQDPVRRDFVDGPASRNCCPQGNLQRRHRHPVRRQQQLVRRLRLLVLQALRPPGRQADRRRPQEVGTRRPRPGHRGPGPGRDQLHREGTGPLDPRTAGRGRRGDRHPEPGRRPLPRRVLRQAVRPGPPAAGGRPARRSHPDRTERPVVQGRQRGRHLQVRRRTDRALRLRRAAGRQGHHRLLPDRRALQPHLVRADRDPRQAQRQELRRLLDRIRLAGRRPRRGRRLSQPTGPGIRSALHSPRTPACSATVGPAPETSLSQIPTRTLAPIRRPKSPAAKVARAFRPPYGVCRNCES